MEFTVFLLLSVASFAPVISDTCQRNPDALFRTEGDVVLVGLFDLHSGDVCEVRKRGGEQQMYAASSTVEWINNSSYFEGINIGFVALDTCSDPEVAMKQVIHGLMETDYVNSCGKQRLLGFIGPWTSHVTSEVYSFLQPLSIPYLAITIRNINAEIEALVAILVHFDWRQVGVLTVSQELKEQFHQSAAKSNICVIVSSILTDSRDEHENFLLRMTETSTNVVVVLGTEVELMEAIQSASSISQEGFYWLAAGMTSRNIDLELEKFKTLIRALIISESSEISNNSELSGKVEEMMRSNKRCTLGDCKNDLLDAGVRETIENVLKYSAAIRELQIEECDSTRAVCSSLAHKLTSLVMLKLKFAEESGGVGESSPLFETINVTLWSYQEERKKGKMLQFHQVGYFAQDRLQINTKKLDILQPMGGGWFKIPHFLCVDDCLCLNANSAPQVGLIKENVNEGVWRTDTWVTVCVTISCIGIMVSLAIFVFILYKMCSDEPIEGHHGFTLLILAGVILLYTATFPYALYPSEIVCAFRMAVLGLGYASVFSPIAARCLMLATSGPLGFTGHINGNIQTALYCFIFGIQIALNVQYWWLNWGHHSSDFSQEGLRCNVNYTTTITSLIYDMMLLAFLLFLSPFCIKARRNHREGLFFHLTSLVIFVLWITWLTLYLLFPSEWAELLLSVGFVASASVAMVIIFLPRVYKIATSTSRSCSKIGLRSLDRLTSSTRTNSTNRNLYSSVKNNYGIESSCQPLKDETESEVYEDGTLPTITHL